MYNVTCYMSFLQWFAVTDEDSKNDSKNAMQSNSETITIFDHAS